MAAAKAEMQLMSPLQISDPFGSFPHSPTMDNYPKLEEMMPVSYTHLTLPTNVSMCRSRWSPYH